MTALLALEALDSGRCELTTMVTAQNDCRDGMSDDSSTSGLLPGMELSMRDLLYCALLQSANEACNIIGRYLGGSISGFVEQMNQKSGGPRLHEHALCEHQRPPRRGGTTAPPTTSRLFSAQRSITRSSARSSTARAISRRTPR